MSIRTIVAAIATAVCAVIVVGCGNANSIATPQPTQVTVRTLPSPGPNDLCMEALISGTLVVDPVSGLGVADTTGRVTHVLWPFGYGALPDGDRLALVDGQNRIVARLGDVISIPGGSASEQSDEWITCQSEPVTIVSTPAP